jgi:hypothetical protein
VTQPASHRSHEKPLEIHTRRFSRARDVGNDKAFSRSFFTIIPSHFLSASRVTGIWPFPSSETLSETTVTQNCNATIFCIGIALNSLALPNNRNHPFLIIRMQRLKLPLIMALLTTAMSLSAALSFPEPSSLTLDQVREMDAFLGHLRRGMKRETVETLISPRFAITPATSIRGVQVYPPMGAGPGLIVIYDRKGLLIKASWDGRAYPRQPYKKPLTPSFPQRDNTDIAGLRGKETLGHHHTAISA